MSTAHGTGGSPRRVAACSSRFDLQTRSFPLRSSDFDALWRGIPEAERAAFVGVTVNCVDELGRLIGTEFPAAVLDSNSSEIRFRYKVRGEKWGFQRIEIMRDHPMPLIEGYLGYVPKSIVWRAIARNYKTRYVNERLRVYWQDQKDGMSRSRVSARAAGGLLEAEMLLNNDLRWFRYDPWEFLRKGAKYARCSFLVGRPIGEQVRSLDSARARLLWAVTLPAGWLFYVVDQLKGNRA